ncbi:uncharacterized protein LOC127414900 isoform X2 [Myxocyprinus asiaticus]|uniref:uncharacterized protein LOC127414900 isoform X2 n=1 Tax=Myxocyprinus asiaticus TaxID=70543 RepID=UPI002221E4B2|nr:uncharacterized protein LOC127414900 isoform X2 [Myxocyprinus asiaticus]
MSLCTLLLLFSLPLSICTHTLERNQPLEEYTHTCGQGIIHCEVKQGSPTCIGHDDHVYVSSLDAYIVPCETQKKILSLCLKILVNLTVRDAGQPVDVELPGDASSEDAEEIHGNAHHEDQDHMTAASTFVCYRSPSHSDSYILQFTFPSSAFKDSTTLQVRTSLLVDIREADLGSPVVVFSSYTKSTKQVIIPPKEKVCSKNLDIIFCNVGPKLRKETDHLTGAVKLYVADADKERFREFQTCQKLEREGGCEKVEWDDARREFEISLGSVAPCLCFEIWGDFPRQEFCPFLNETVVSSRNVSLSVAETATHNKATDNDITALIWNVIAPCRLHTELWLCMKDSAPGSSCHQINNTLHVHHHQNDRWTNTEHRLWQLQGEFLEVKHHPSLCVQVKVKGMDGNLGPVCPFEVKRTHWSFPLLVCVIFMCLSVLGVYAVQDWVFRWLKVDDLNSGAGGVEVLLVYPPDAEDNIMEQVCRLGSSLSNLGFSVFLDLWSRSELNTLGPVPWLRSRLDHVQRCGGKAVFVLSPAACERAEEWSCRGAGKDLKEDKKINKFLRSSMVSDVFTASLSCILADYLLGRVGERFVLAEFEARSPGSHGAIAALPEFFRGLPLFILPSESMGFLLELTRGAHKGQGTAGRWIRAREMRAASLVLSGALCDLTGHTCAGRVESGTEDACESVPLQPDQSTTPVNPTFYTKSSTKG